jgi:hypothetical protein
MDPKQTDGAAFEDIVADLFDPAAKQDDDAEEKEEDGVEEDEGEGEGEDNDK